MKRIIFFTLTFLIIATNNIKGQSQILTEGLITYTVALITNDMKEFNCDLTFSRTESLFKSQKYIDSKLVDNKLKTSTEAAEEEDSDVDFVLNLNIPPIYEYLCLHTSLIDSTIQYRSYDLVDGEVKKYVVDEPTGRIKWTITNETKNVGNLKCKKANCRFRGRNYTAWFTEEIPLPFGPWKINGLPGLILEVVDEENEVRFLANNINVERKMREMVFPTDDAEFINYEASLRNQDKFTEEILNLIKAKLPRDAKATINTVNNNALEREP